MNIQEAVDITRFPIKQGGSRAVIIGRSQSGKTWLVIHILMLIRAQLGKLMKLIIISPNLRSDKTWKKFRNQLHYDEHFEHPTPDVISRINGELRRQKRWIETGKGRKPPFLVILIDDLGDNTTLRQGRLDNPIRELFNKAAHRRTMLFDLCQKFNQTLTDSRVSAEFACLQKTFNHEELRLFAKTFMGHLTESQKRQVYHDAFEGDDDYATLYVNRSGPGRPRIYKGVLKPVDITPAIDT